MTAAAAVGWACKRLPTDHWRDVAAAGSEWWTEAKLLQSYTNRMSCQYCKSATQRCLASVLNCLQIRHLTYQISDFWTRTNTAPKLYMIEGIFERSYNFFSRETCVNFYFDRIQRMYKWTSYDIFCTIFSWKKCLGFILAHFLDSKNSSKFFASCLLSDLYWLSSHKSTSHFELRLKHCQHQNEQQVGISSMSACSGQYYRQAAWPEWAILRRACFCFVWLNFAFLCDENHLFL